MSLSRELDVDRARAAMEHVESHRGDEPREAFELASEWARLGRLGANTADLDRAESLAREAETDAGLTLPLLVLRATIATARVDYRQAEECYRQALQLQPGNPGILNNLAYLLLKRDPSSSEALQYSTRAVTLEPNNPNMLDTHARALLGGGRLREAAEYAQRAIDANSGDPTPRLTMARIHIAGGRTAEAAAQLDRAQQLLEAMARRDEALWGELAALRRKLEEQAASASP
jgi:Tfp pilus assembly protein PilF